MTSPDDYAALHESAVIGAIAARGQVAVAGPERAAFLHGLLTNDTASLVPGRGCYAAWLTPQGRMLCDLHVLESGDMMLLDVPAADVIQIADRLEQFHFTEDVEIAVLDTLRSVWVHGPSAARVLGHEEYESWAQYQNARVELAGAPVVLARIDQLGVPGFVIFTDAQQQDEVTRAVAGQGALHATPAMLEAARIEARYPIFGIDMTSDTIPLEAGIEERAISLTKGCYVGQEVIIRVLHRGHGRVARKLVTVKLEAPGVEAGAKVLDGERAVGFVTSAAVSPQSGPIALAYVHRDLATEGARVAVETPSGHVSGVVAVQPLRQPST